MIQRITPDMVGADIYQMTEACITNNAKRMMHYDWYAAARSTGSQLPGLVEMRNYGRECTLAYVLEGKPIEEALKLGTSHMYHRVYDDARNLIRNFGYGGGRDKIQAITSVVDTHTASAFDERGEQVSAATTGAYNKLIHFDDNRMFETLDWIAAMPLPDMDKHVLTLYAVGYTTTEAAAELGIGRTTLVMRIPKIAERMRDIWSTESSSDWATSWKMRTATA